MRPAFLFAACSLFAQESTTIRVDVQQVLVPVVVTDSKGHHVSGLHASDFRIFEDGVPQDIAAFSGATAASVDDIAALAKASTAPAASGPRRTIVICIDTLHASASSGARIRTALVDLFEKEKAGDSQYVLIGIGRHMQVLQAATANPLAVLLKVKSAGFQAMLGGLDGSALAAETNNLRSRMEQFCKRCACVARTNQSCDSEVDSLKQSVDDEASRWTAPIGGLTEQFRSVVEELAKLPTSRTLILVSDGFGVNPTREFYSLVSSYLPNRSQFRLDDPKTGEPALRDALRIAADRNVIVYTVDSRGGAAPSLASSGPMDAGAGGMTGGGYGIAGSTRGRTTPSTALTGSLPTNTFGSDVSGTMDQLARSTGGIYFHDATDMLKELRGAFADGREYYMLAYVPKNGARDGKFRAISVQTTDRRFVLRAKSGYWAVGAAQ